MITLAILSAVYPMMGESFDIRYVTKPSVVVEIVPQMCPQSAAVLIRAEQVKNGSFITNV